MPSVQAIEYKFPEYTLKVEATGTGIDIRLNDITIAFEQFKGHSITTYDVNQSIIRGINELKVIIFPFFYDSAEKGQSKEYHLESEIIASLYVNEKNNTENRTIISKIHIKRSLTNTNKTFSIISIDNLNEIFMDVNNQPLQYPVYPIQNQITFTQKTLPVQNDYHHWAWQDGQLIESNSENYKSLLSTYHEIYETHKSKNKGLLFSFEKEAAKEYALAYSKNGTIADGHKLTETAEIFDNPDAELYDFYTDGMKLDIFANGKMAKIINLAQYHPIIYTHKTLDIVFALKFAFYKNKENKWIMIR